MRNQYHIGITFGALAEPIAKQIIDQGKTASIKNMQLWQKQANAISFLKIHGLLADGHAHAAHKKLIKLISSGIK